MFIYLLYIRTTKGFCHTPLILIEALSSLTVQLCLLGSNLNTLMVNCYVTGMLEYPSRHNLKKLKLWLSIIVSRNLKTFKGSFDCIISLDFLPFILWGTIFLRRL